MDGKIAQCRDNQDKSMLKSVESLHKLELAREKERVESLKANHKAVHKNFKIVREKHNLGP